VSWWLQAFVVASLSMTVALQVALLLRPVHVHVRDPIDVELRDLLRELAAVFREWPDAFGVLDEIVAQFKTNTGHSMRDLLDRLDKAATVAATATEASVAAVQRLSTVVTLGAATGLRIEAQHADVAEDLRLSHERADAVQGHPGEAADAAAQSSPTEHVSDTDSIGETHERP
jgi:hypothetical protein